MRTIILESTEFYYLDNAIKTEERFVDLPKTKKGRQSLVIVDEFLQPVIMFLMKTK